ncbi:MAG TPA: hypothetical protein VIG93_04425 [Gaiellaceae bacterium]
MSRTQAQFLRFLVVGGVNTAVTTVLFYGLALVVPPRVAFTLVYVGGLAFVTMATPKYVFRVRARASRLALLAVWYVGIYLVGLAVVSGLDAISDSRAVIVLGTVLVTAPLGFAGGRLLVGRGTDSSSEDPGAHGRIMRV